MAQLQPDAIRERIRLAREEAGMTQQDLADALELHKRTIENYENVRVPDYRQLNRIARVLNRPVEWFLHGDAASTADGVSPDQFEEVLARVEAVHADVRQLQTLVESLRGDPVPRS